MLRIPGGGGGDGGVTSHPTGCERRALLGCEAFSTKTRKDSGKWVQLVSLRQGDQFYLPSPFYYQLVSPRESKHACPQDRRGCVLHAYVKGVELQISFLCRRFSIPFRMRCLLRLPRIPQHLLPSAHPRAACLQPPSGSGSAVESILLSPLTDLEGTSPGSTSSWTCSQPKCCQLAFRGSYHSKT